MRIVSRQIKWRANEFAPLIAPLIGSEGLKQEGFSHFCEQTAKQTLLDQRLFFEGVITMA
jgi:hypothetical protein